MSKSIKSLVISGVSQKTGNPYSLLSVVQGQYPWSIGAQECLRVLGAARVLGPDGLATVLEGFVGGTQYQETAGHCYTEFKGHNLLSLRVDAADKRPLSFGAGKAKGLLAIVKEYGAKALVGVCAEIAGDAKPSAYSPKGGKKKTDSAPKARKGGGGGKGRAVEADDSEGMDELPGLSEGLKGQLLKIAEATVASPAPQTDTLDALEARRMELTVELYRLNMRIAALSAAVAV